MKLRQRFGCVWLLGLVAVAGCGSSGPQYDTARLEGRLQIDGVPVSAGSVQFIPLGKAQPAWAQVTDGRYLAERVPIGQVRVLFTAIRETGRMENDGAHEFPERVNLVPAKFRSGMDLKVPGDNPSQDFLLSSR